MGASCSKAVPAAIADAPPNLAEVALAVANAGSVIQLVSQPLLRRCAGAMWEPLSPLNYREDERVMKIAMEKTRKHFRWRQEYATLRGFYSLFKEDCDVLHFTGHGAQGCIFLEDRLGRAMPVDKEMLAELLDVAKRPALVFVSACQSESVAEVFIGAGISHVIAIASEENVLESDATIFAELFYELLFSGQTVQWSFDAAYNRVRFNKEDTAHKFKLLPENADHEVSIFRHLREGELVMVPRAPTVQDGRFRRPPAPCSPFVGRQHYVQNIYKILVGRRDEGSVICLVGAIGIGKSEIALTAAQYAVLRGTVSHAPYVNFRAHQPDDVDSNAAAVCGAALGVGYCPDAEALAKKLKDIFGAPRFKPLLILDNVDEWRTGAAAASFLQMLRLLARRIRNLRILLTSEKRLRVPATRSLKVMEITELRRQDAAKLFICSMTRSVALRELCEGGEGLSREEAMEKFSNSRIVEITRWHPKVIVELARAVRKLDFLSDTDEILRMGQVMYEGRTHRPRVSSSQTSTRDMASLQRASSYQSPAVIAMRHNVASRRSKGCRCTQRGSAALSRGDRPRPSTNSPIPDGGVRTPGTRGTAAPQPYGEDEAAQRVSAFHFCGCQRPASPDSLVARDSETTASSHKRPSSLLYGRLTETTFDESEDPFDQAESERGDGGSVIWGSLRRHIQQEMLSNLAWPEGRVLEDSDLDYLARGNAWWREEGPQSDDDEVDRDTWKSFRKYVGRILYALHSTTLWEARTPSGEWLLQPFTENKRLVEILDDESRPIGDSLIKVSKNKLNTLGFVCKKATGALIMDVTIEQYGHAVKILDHDNGRTPVEYESFQSLVLETDDITHINGVPKYDVFDPEEYDEAAPSMHARRSGTTPRRPAAEAARAPTEEVARGLGARRWHRCICS